MRHHVSARCSSELRRPTRGRKGGGGGAGWGLGRVGCMGSGWGCGEMARLQRSRRPHLNWKRTVCARDEERAAPLVAGSQTIIPRPGANADGPSMGRGAAAPDRAECADEDAAAAQSTFLHLRSRMCIPSAKYVLACAPASRNSHAGPASHGNHMAARVRSQRCVRVKSLDSSTAPPRPLVRALFSAPCWLATERSSAPRDVAESRLALAHGVPAAGPQLWRICDASSVTIPGFKPGSDRSQRSLPHEHASGRAVRDLHR